MTKKTAPDTNEQNESKEAKPEEAEGGSPASGLQENLAKVDKMVTEQKKKLEDDPDDFVDKLIKMALPAMTGFVVSKLISLGWDAIFHQGRFSKNDQIEGVDEDEVISGDEASQGILMGMLFAAVSGALGSLASTVSTKESQRLVNKRQDKRQDKHQPKHQPKGKTVAMKSSQAGKASKMGKTSKTSRTFIESKVSPAVSH